MKRILYIAFFLSTLSFDGFLAWQTFRSFDTPDRTPIDFRLRMNESDCIRDGINPFDICLGRLTSAKYFPLLPLSEKVPAEHDAQAEVVGLYPPWSYALYLPLAAMPRNLAWWLWTAFSLTSFLALGVAGFVFCKSSEYSICERLCLSGAALSIGAAAVVDLWCGNCCLVMSAALLVLCLILSHPKKVALDIVGAIALSLLMMKPQTGLLFVVPILLARRFRLVLIAALVCCACSIYPSLLCHTSPIELALQAPQASAPGFKGCAFMPIELAQCLCDTFGIGIQGPLVLSAFLGLVLCIWFSYRLRSESSWLLRMAIPAVLSVSWTYAAFYNHCICWVVLIVLTIDFLRAKRLLHRIVDVVAFFCVARGARYVVRALETVDIPIESYCPGFGDHLSWLASLLGVALTLAVIGRRSREGVAIDCSRA